MTQTIKRLKELMEQKDQMDRRMQEIEDRVDYLMDTEDPEVEALDEEWDQIYTERGEVMQGIRESLRELTGVSEAEAHTMIHWGSDRLRSLLSRWEVRS